MSYEEPEIETPEVRFGYTATGRVRHVIDDWNVNPRQKSMCNIVVRDIEEMAESFGLGSQEISLMCGLDWCEKCGKWLKTMRYLRSRGKLLGIPSAVIDYLSRDYGLDEEDLADVIDFAAWKQARGRDCA